MNYAFVGTSEVQSATLNFQKAKSDKKEVYKIRLNDKEVTVTVGGDESGEIVDFVPSNVYLDNSKTKITLSFAFNFSKLSEADFLNEIPAFKVSISFISKTLSSNFKVKSKG